MGWPEADFEGMQLPVLVDHLPTSHLYEFETEDDNPISLTPQTSSKQCGHLSLELCMHQVQNPLKILSS